jgi:hypothetical protein
MRWKSGLIAGPLRQADNQHHLRLQAKGRSLQSTYRYKE